MYRVSGYTGFGPNPSVCHGSTDVDSSVLDDLSPPHSDAGEQTEQEMGLREKLDFPIRKAGGSRRSSRGNMFTR